jgi:transcriptional regulator with XRE-family HTH domain
MTGMSSATTLSEILSRSAMTKSALCAAAGVSRALFDDYLKGRTQPGVGQLVRIAEAAGMELDLVVRPQPRPLPESFVAVLEFGELFPRRPARPLINLGPTWRRAAERRAHG